MDQPTNKQDAESGNVSAIRHISYGEGYKDGKHYIKDLLKSWTDDLTNDELISKIKLLISE
jgi:hypothetical protein